VARVEHFVRNFATWTHSSLFLIVFDCLYLIVRLYSELKDLTLDSPNAPNAFHGFVVRAQESSILLNSFFQ